MCPSDLLLRLLVFWHTLQPVHDELAGKVVPYAGRTVRGWNLLLKRGQEADASRAISALVALGPEARLAVPTLKEVLLHGPPRQRRSACQALGQLGPHFPEAVDALVDGMQNPNLTIRRAAYEGLARLDAPTLQRLAPDLVAQLDDQPSRFRRNLLEVLEQADLHPDKHLPLLQKLLAHDRTDVQRLAITCFRKAPRNALHVPLLEPLLKDGGYELRNRTLQVLCLFAGEGKAPAKYLVQGLQHDDEDVRQAALEGVVALGDKARHLESELLLVVEQVPEGMERLAVAQALWRCCRHPQGKAAVLSLFRDGSSGMQLPAALVLADVGRGDKETLLALRELLLAKDARPDRLPLSPFSQQGDAIFPLLEDALRDPRSGVRQKALDILRDLPAAHRARAAGLLLRCCRTDPLPALQHRAALCLWSMSRHPSALEYLALLLEEESIPRSVRRMGLQQFPVQGPLAERAVPHLLAALRSPEASLREAAAEQLGGCTVLVAEVVDALCAALADKDQDVREAAARVLRTLGPAARHAVPDLWRRLDDSAPSVQKEALLSLAAVHPEPARLVPRALMSLGHYDTGVQAAALEVLTVLKPDRQEALPLLRNLLRDRDASTRLTALRIVDRMELPDALAEEVLVPLLADPDDSIRSVIIAALGRRPALSPALLAKLRQMVLAEEGRSRLAAALAVWKHDRNPLALAVLRNGLKDRSPDSCIYAVECLDQIGPDARSAAPQLLPLLHKALRQIAAESAMP